MWFHRRVAIALHCVLTAVAASAQTPLTDKLYAQVGSSKGVVLLHVNWGRYWGCGPVQNAQLQLLAFRRIMNGVPEEIEWQLKPASKLFAKPVYEKYAFVVEPGQYALSAVRLKVSDSVQDVRIATAGTGDLIQKGKPVGGSFSVVAGEIIYIGHFGVDCNGSPTPWRFYVEGKQEFDRYAAGFHAAFPSTRDTPVAFRLLETEYFGSKYELR